MNCLRTGLFLLIVLITAFSILKQSHAQTVELNPNIIRGSVEIGANTITSLSMRADSTVDSYNATQTTYPNMGTAPYELTVHVDSGAVREYKVDASIQFGSKRMLLRDRVVSVSDGVATEQNILVANPAVLQSEVIVTGGGLINRFYLYAQQTTAPYDYYNMPSSSNINQTKANVSMPVIPEQQIRCGGSVTLTSGVSISLPSQIVTTPTIGSVDCNYTVATPLLGNIAGTIDFTGINAVDRYYIPFSGPSNKSTYIYQNSFGGPYNLADYEVQSLTEGDNYQSYAAVYSNNNDDYFRFPDSAYTPARTGHKVVAGSVTSMNIEACQAYFNGSIDFTGSTSLQDLSSGTIYLQGDNSAGSLSRYGYAYDRLSPSSGDFDLIVSDGDWRISQTYYTLSRNTGHARGFLNERLNLYFPSNFVTTSCGSTTRADYSFATGSTTISFAISGGQTLSSPRISGFCEYRDPSTNDRLYYYSYNSYSSGQNNVQQASLSFEGPEATCTLKAEAAVNGSFLTIGNLTGINIEPGATVIIDVGGPTIANVMPETDFYIDADSIVVTGIATDDSVVSSVMVNGVSATLTSTGNSSDPAEVSFSVSVPLSRKGPNSLTIVATDSAGKVGQFTQTVFNDAGPPTVDFSPADGTSTSNNQIDIVDGIVGDDAGIDSVAISVNGSLLATLDAGGALSIDFHQLAVELLVGSNTITVVATDISGRETVVVRGVERLANATPIAQNLNLETDEDVSLYFTLSGLDADGDEMAFVVRSNPINGTLSGTPPNLTYIANENFNGSDSFTYHVNDGSVDSDFATVSVTINAINDKPVADSLSLTSEEDTTKPITLMGTDVENAPLTFIVTGGPAYGSLVGTNQHLTYTPMANFCGLDSFTVVANDGISNSEKAAISLELACVNDLPTAADLTVDSNEDAIFTGAVTGSDVDNDSLIFVLEGAPSNGTLQFSTNGSFSYTPESDYNGLDSFYFITNDGVLDSEIATVNITVHAVNDAPSFSLEKITVVDEDSGMQFAQITSGYSAGPADEYGQSPEYFVSNVVNGNILASGPIVNSSGVISYEPAPNANGTVTFDLQVQDNGGVDRSGDDISQPQAVSIVVSPINDSPIVVNQISDVVVEEDSPDAVLNLSTVFSDVDILTNNDSLVLSIDGNNNPDMISVSLLGKTLTLNFHDDQQGTAIVLIRATDVDGLYVVDEFTVTVNPVNDAPTVAATPVAVSVQYSDPVMVTISSNDIDSTTLTSVTSQLPEGLELSSAICMPDAPPLNCEWTISGNITERPGNYAVTVSTTDNGELTDSNALSASTTVVFTVSNEDARSTYTGPLFLGSEENGNYSVTLMATIRDVSSAASDATWDSYAGDIRNASVRFENDAGDLLCDDTELTLVFADDETIGSASCLFAGTLGNNDELPIEVNIVVNNYYTDTSDNEAVLLVVRPGEGKITGGGQLTLHSSAGLYTATQGQPFNYGFNARAVKKGKKTQYKGRVTMILRADDGRKYKIKSNAILSLGVELDPDGNGDSSIEPHYAEFDSKANLTDITDELNPQSLGGNLLLQLRMTDNGEPGESDTISVTLWDEGTILFSSNWDGAQTLEQSVARGNLQVH